MRPARGWLALSLSGGLAWAGAARAETLPLTRLDVADGLAHSRVTSILQARRGDLWFTTWEGVSRYDGYRFTTYGRRDGLPENLITCAAEDREGRLWFGSFSRGVFRLLDDPKERGADASVKFEMYAVDPDPASGRVGALAVDARDRLWCGTSKGVFRADLRGAGPPRFEVVLPGVSVDWPQLLALDEKSRAWIGDGRAVVEIGDAGIVTHPLPPGVEGEMWNVVPARRGGLWVSVGDLLWRLVPKGEGRERDAWERIPVSLQAGSYIRIVTDDPDGALWIGTYDGLVRWQDGRATSFTTEQGLPDDKIRALRVDADGNLWLGTHNAGVAKLPRRGVVNITTADGLPDRNVLSVVESADGRIYAGTDRGGIVEITHGRAVPIPGSERLELRDLGFNMVQDRSGDWWLGAASGLYRFDGPGLQLVHGTLLGAEDGLPEPGLVMGIYRDRDGTLWVGQGTHWLVHLWPSRERPLRVERVSLPTAGDQWLARRMLRDRSGRLWISSFGSLGRLAGHEIATLAGSPGLPDVEARWLFEDRDGRMWLAHRNGGISMTEDPGSAAPRFRSFSTREGLISDVAWTIAADDAGRIYVGTARGLDRLEPASGRILHMGPADGLAGSIVNGILKDAHGVMWVATSGGITILDPKRELGPTRAPPVYLSRVAVAGEDVPLPESGVRGLGALTLPWPRNTISFEWVAIAFEGERDLRYAWRLEGADRDWSAPSAARGVNYANLGPGRYVFRVRAAVPDGAAPVEDASVSFRILPPLWRRGWFLALMAILAAAAVFGAYELRIRRIVALERIRRQIATDLHDEMGSGLAQIAVLSEVAKRRTGRGDAHLLDEVGRLSRDLRESMSDIVWSVDPRRDRLSDLVMRLKQVARNLFESDGARVTFETPSEEALAAVELAPDRKRQLYLAAKEALTNVARHARAGRVAVGLELSGSRITLRIVDDGCGFDPGARSDGRGLVNLRRRAEALGGSAAITSAPGRGCEVRLTSP
ncbi:MAG TPA: two-component regulator propeller domain-containing protein [Candidatus Polarisedimenticolaceae bacterium]|nr:two-component regulator propeller domain-containing protein [Candidatus Polarisedimenticolaceae bacterium]